LLQKHADKAAVAEVTSICEAASRTKMAHGVSSGVPYYDMYIQNIDTFPPNSAKLTRFSDIPCPSGVRRSIWCDSPWFRPGLLTHAPVRNELFGRQPWTIGAREP
jgi:hypothetical protein